MTGTFSSIGSCSQPSDSDTMSASCVSTAHRIACNNRVSRLIGDRRLLHKYLSEILARLDWVVSQIIIFFRDTCNTNICKRRNAMDDRQHSCSMPTFVLWYWLRLPVIFPIVVPRTRRGKHVQSGLQLSVYTSSFAVESGVYDSNLRSLVHLHCSRDMTQQPRLGDVVKPIPC
jgi:hypothetical protein